MGGQQSHSISEPGHSRPLEFSIHPVFTLPPPRSPRSALSVRSISSEVLRHSLKLGSLPSAPQHLSASQVPVRFFKMIKTEIEKRWNEGPKKYFEWISMGFLWSRKQESDSAKAEIPFPSEYFAVWSIGRPWLEALFLYVQIIRAQHGQPKYYWKRHSASHHLLGRQFWKGSRKC